MLIASSNNVAFAALIWWVIPLIGVIGAIAYVVWVSKFADKYSNETNRSVGNFSKFQASFRADQARKNVDQRPSSALPTQPSTPPSTPPSTTPTPPIPPIPPTLGN